MPIIRLFKKIHNIRCYKKSRIACFSFLFKKGLYIYRGQIIKKASIKTLVNKSFFRNMLSLFYFNHDNNENGFLLEGEIREGAMKYAIIFEEYTYLIFKNEKQYKYAKETYKERLKYLNYKTIHFYDYDDIHLSVKTNTLIGLNVAIKKESLLKELIFLFECQNSIVLKNKTIFYMQHGDPLPKNIAVIRNGNGYDYVFRDLDDVKVRPALFDFFYELFVDEAKPVNSIDIILETRESYNRFLYSAFLKHGIIFTNSIFDEYLSLFVEYWISIYKGGYEDHVVGKPISWIIDKKLADHFPLTNIIVRKHTISIEGLVTKVF